MLPFDTLACLGDLIISTLSFSLHVNLLVGSSSISGPFADIDSTGGLLAQLISVVCRITNLVRSVGLSTTSLSMLKETFLLTLFGWFLSERILH